jgi:hypothetical protein
MTSMAGPVQNKGENVVLGSGGSNPSLAAKFRIKKPANLRWQVFQQVVCAINSQLVCPNHGPSL